MSKTEIPKDVMALVEKVGRDFGSEQDLLDFTSLLTKVSVEAALGAELNKQLGYEKFDPAGRGSTQTYP